MFFGILCTYAVAYGALTLFSGFVSALTPVNKIADYTAKKVVEFQIEDLQLKNGEGVLDLLQEGQRFVLAEAFPALADFNNEKLQAVLHQAYWLSKEEIEDLRLMLDPIDGFARWSGNVAGPLKRSQYALMLYPIIDYLEKIPPLRQEKK